MAKGNFIRSLRQMILLTILFMVAVGSYLTRANSTSWEESLWVTVYPITTKDEGVASEAFRAGSLSRGTARIGGARMLGRGERRML